MYRRGQRAGFHVSRDQGLGVCERVAASLAAVHGWDAAMTARMLDEYRAEVATNALQDFAHGAHRILGVRRARAACHQLMDFHRAS